MQSHLPEERKIMLEQIDAQLRVFATRRVMQSTPIEKWEIAVSGTAQPPARGPKTGWKPYKMNTHWGEDQPDLTVWFRAKTKVPKDFVASGTFVELGLAPSREALCYINGTPHQGLSENHTSIRINRKDMLTKQLSLLIEAYTEHPRRPDPVYDGRFRFAEVRQVDKTVHDFYHDLKAGIETAKSLDRKTKNFQVLLQLLDEAMQAIHPFAEDPAAFRKQVAAAMKEYRAGVAKLPSESGRGKLLLCGHSHIDTAWLWTLLETERKCGRTFSTVLSLMEAYPEYTFQQSQPQLYEYTKKNYPEVYEGIKKRVKEGRWDPSGAPWVEMDPNVTGGEALIRQMLYGNLYFEKEFGKRTNICWLPDAFGYNWNLPQILKKSGVDVFITTKIDWSEVTTFPYSLFDWEGADGSRVVGLMPPLNYNGLMKPGDLQEHWDRIKQKNIIDEMVYPFGWGDGGGGPTEEMIEMGRRMLDMTGIPKSRFGTVTEYCNDLLDSIDRPKLPVWNGELYLEFHRACQTTQARTKRNNRKMEVLLRDAEIASSWAHLLGGKYPQAEFEPIWRMVMTNQFHDILPGSSVEEVYVEADRNYAKGQADALKLRQNGVAGFTRHIDTRGEGDPVVVSNSLAWERFDPAFIPVSPPRGKFHIVNSDGKPVAHQVVVGPDGKKGILAATHGVPSMGHEVFRIVPGEAAVEDNYMLKVSAKSLENEFFRINLDSKGRLSRVYDKIADREVLAPGEKANLLQMFHDEPHQPDAWDFDFNFEDNQWEWDDVQSIEVVETGPVRGVVRVVRKTAKSTLTQNIIVYRDVPRVDFETEVDWHEKRVLLKAAFPVNVKSAHATYEIQLAAVERATHRNMPFDRARFEVPHHRWADLSEGNYGVAVANDCKYGFDTVNNVMRLSLLRASTEPDGHADEGSHQFTYSLLPHWGDWREGEVVRRSAELNIPLEAVPVKSSAGPLPSRYSWISVDAENVAVEAVKKSERGKELIVRLYETNGQRGNVRVYFGFPVKKVTEVDLMEEQDKPVKVAKDTISFDIAPFEIRTFKVWTR